MVSWENCLYCPPFLPSFPPPRNRPSRAGGNPVVACRGCGVIRQRRSGFPPAREYPCWPSRGFREIAGLIRGMLSNPSRPPAGDGIPRQQQLAHSRHHRHFARLALFLQAVIKAAPSVVLTPQGSQRRPRQGPPHYATPAPDRPVALLFPAVLRPGGQPGQGGQGLALPRPSSGSQASRVAAVWIPTPRTLQYNLACGARDWLLCSSS